jgi:hypothetical protein
MQMRNANKKLVKPQGWDGWKTGRAHVKSPDNIKDSPVNQTVVAVQRRILWFFDGVSVMDSQKDILRIHEVCS